MLFPFSLASRKRCGWSARADATRRTKRACPHYRASLPMCLHLCIGRRDAAETATCIQTHRLSSKDECKKWRSHEKPLNKYIASIATYFKRTRLSVVTRSGHLHAKPNKVDRAGPDFVKRLTYLIFEGPDYSHFLRTLKRHVMTSHLISPKRTSLAESCRNSRRLCSTSACREVLSENTTRNYSYLYTMYSTCQRTRTRCICILKRR